MTSDKRRRHRPDQIIRKLAEDNKLLAGGQELDEVCRHLEIAESTWRRWLAQHGGRKGNDAKRLEEFDRCRDPSASCLPRTRPCRSPRSASTQPVDRSAHQGPGRQTQSVGVPIWSTAPTSNEH